MNISIRSIPKRWRLLSGQNNWQNLLKPLDSDLQQYVIHYGAMAQATYDTFNSNRRSKFAGSSRYSRRNLFSRVGLVKGNPFKYEAVKYIYATSNICVPESFIVKSLCEEAWCKDSNWMGYVAVATDEGKIALGRRDILVAWRGTIELAEWVKDLDFPLASAAEIVGRVSGNARVHEGYLSIYTSDNRESKFNKTSVLSEVQKQVEKHKDEEISITVAGHSLGAALATLNAADIGALRSMNDLHILNVYNFPDIIPHLPPLFDYTGVGVALTVDSTMSPFLKPGDVSTWHNLEAAYLHPLATARPGL
ncbi:hypothetical protein DH2020_031396 [Rehmannia glutinosa]|uniref:Phospholipase A1 n=1 Tax=Rehmannia glutinosa TaxID=99300 RepID=A0ABR0VI23_REHGL